MSFSSHTTPNIAIMGTGMVGGALDRFLRVHRHIRAGLYDPPKGLHDRSVLARADIIFIAVPTPFDAERGTFDESYLRAALNAIPGTGKLIVFKSTVLPGTTDAFQKAHAWHRFVFNPEFLTEATADQDMEKPNRQLVGITPASEADAVPLLRLLPTAPFRRIIPARTAEMVKYFCNAFYALKVAYANQMYDLAQRIGVDYEMIKECVQPEPMMGTNHLEIFHNGYRGYGGKCLPKDTRAIITLGNAVGMDMTLLKAAEAYNNALQLAHEPTQEQMRPARRRTSATAVLRPAQATQQ